jgi:hypothetical protein
VIPITSLWFVLGIRRIYRRRKIKVGGKILDRGEWLDGIRKSWGFKGKEGEEGEGEKVEGKVSRKEGFLEKIGIKS